MHRKHVSFHRHHLLPCPCMHDAVTVEPEIAVNSYVCMRHVCESIALNSRGGTRVIIWTGGMWLSDIRPWTRHRATSHLCGSRKWSSDQFQAWKHKESGKRGAAPEPVPLQMWSMGEFDGKALIGDQKARVSVAGLYPLNVLSKPCFIRRNSQELELPSFYHVKWNACHYRFEKV